MHAALVVLAFMLQFTQCGAPTSGVKRSAIDTVWGLGTAAMAHPGPGGHLKRGVAMPPCNTMWEHLHASSQAQHPARAPLNLEPGLKVIMEFNGIQWKSTADAGIC